MPPADDTGGREARSPATAAAARARRARQIRDRQGLNSGATPAATAAAVPVITPAVGTADAMDGGVELSTGDGDAGDLPATGAVREAIKALSRTNVTADMAATGQAAGDAAGYRTPAQTQDLPLHLGARQVDRSASAPRVAEELRPVLLRPA